MEKYKLIPLSNFNMNVFVDPEDYDRFKDMKWHISKQGYVCSPARIDGKAIQRYLHREIMGAPKGMDVDHIDRNRLNNVKANLRIATRSENMANVVRRNKGTTYSQYKGVTRYFRPNMTKPWVANIKVNYQNYALGYFATEEEAALAYDCAAIQLFGDFASLNML